MLSVVVENKIKNNEQLLVSKGAPEEIFKRCSHYEINGKVVKLDNKTFSNLKKEYEKLSKEGFIVLAIAYRKFIQKKGKYSVNDENLLILKGYAAFLDPAKPRVKQAIDLLEAHGIEVKILTGDNELITQKICKDVDIKIKGILTGDLIDNMDDIKLKLAVEDNTIFARMNPQQKERVILALKSNNHVVGYLGDGINDAPSLRAADVGITVNNAVDVAKESADIVLLEKSLIVLNVGVIEGRKTFGNIIKYIKMSASSNFGNMFSISGATLFLPFLPMLPVQILFNNFLYDLSQITIPSDDVDKEYLKNPHDWNVGFIKRFIIFIGPLSSIYDFITFGILIFVFKANEALFHTGWFIESLCTQVLVIYVIRTNKIPFIQSRPSKALVFSTLGIIALAIIVPFTKLGTYLGFVNLPPLYFGILFILIFTYLLLVQLVKTWLVRKYGFQ
jgi:Mg2+-importing ATPase